MATTLTKLTNNAFDASKKLQPVGLQLWRYCKSETITSFIKTSLIMPRYKLVTLRNNLSHPEVKADGDFNLAAFPMQGTPAETKITGEKAQTQAGELKKKIELILNEYSQIVSSAIEGNKKEIQSIISYIGKEHFQTASLTNTAIVMIQSGKTPKQSPSQTRAAKSCGRKAKPITPDTRPLDPCGPNASTYPNLRGKSSAEPYTPRPK